MKGGDNSAHGNAGGAGGEIADSGSDVEGGYDVINVTPVDRRFLCLKCGDMFPVKEAYLDHVKSCAGSQAGTEPADQEGTGETPPPPKPASPAADPRKFFRDPLELTLGVGPAPLPPPPRPPGSKSCIVLGKELSKAVEGGTGTVAAAAAEEVGSASEEDEVDLALKL